MLGLCLHRLDAAQSHPATATAVAAGSRQEPGQSPAHVPEKRTARLLSFAHQEVNGLPDALLPAQPGYQPLVVVRRTTLAPISASPSRARMEGSGTVLPVTVMESNSVATRPPSTVPYTLKS